MAFKPNYNQSRRERERNKALKKQEKQQRREEAAALRKVDPDAPQDAAGDPESAAPGETDGAQETPR